MINYHAHYQAQSLLSFGLVIFTGYMGCEFVQQRQIAWRQHCADVLDASSSQSHLSSLVSFGCQVLSFSSCALICSLSRKIVVD